MRYIGNILKIKKYNCLSDSVSEKIYPKFIRNEEGLDFRLRGNNNRNAGMK